MLSIIIPAYNEEKRIAPTLLKISSFFKLNRTKLKDWADFEIILVSDGSDNTVNVAKTILKSQNISKNLKTLDFSKRLGKGSAVKTGLLLCKGDAIIYDADGSTPIDQIFKIRKEFDGGAGLVIGSRKNKESIIRNNINLKRRLTSRIFNLFVKLFFGINFKDTQCGFKGIRKEFVKPLAHKLNLRGYEFDVQLINEANKKGIKTSEIPVVWSHVDNGSLTSFSIISGASMFISLLRYKLSS